MDDAGWAEHISCATGTAPGFWTGLHWAVNRAPGCVARDYVRVSDVCMSTRRNVSFDACVTKDAEALQELGGASLLMFGDSTARTTMHVACGAFRLPRSNFLRRVHLQENGSFTPFKLTPKSPYWRRATIKQHSSDHHGCSIGLGQTNLSIGSFAHYGVTGPPYWGYAYPAPPWLGRTTLEQISADLPDFSTTFLSGCDPTLIVINSAYWDISSWWIYDGHSNASFRIGATQVSDYLAGIARIVFELRRTFPTSRLAWRTVHPASRGTSTGRGITLPVTRMLNLAVRTHARALGLRIVDVGTMIEQLRPPRVLGRGPTTDGRHLHQLVDVPVLNLLLNTLREAKEAGARRVKPSRLATGAASRGRHRSGVAARGEDSCPHIEVKKALTHEQLFGPVPLGAQSPNEAFKVVEAAVREARAIAREQASTYEERMRSDPTAASLLRLGQTAES